MVNVDVKVPPTTPVRVPLEVSVHPATVS